MRRQGFTLIELMVVIAIITVLAMLLLPAIYVVTRRARAMECLNNMKGIGVALNAWSVTSAYVPVKPTAPPEAVTYFTNKGWNEQAHNNLYCWKTGGSDAPNEGRNIIPILYPQYINAGKAFYCPAFNRKDKRAFNPTQSGSINFEGCWNASDPKNTAWWGYEWVNPRFEPMPQAWVDARYGSGAKTTNPTRNAVMFCHFSTEHAGVLYADGAAESSRNWSENGRPYGW